MKVGLKVYTMSQQSLVSLVAFVLQLALQCCKRVELRCRLYRPRTAECLQHRRVMSMNADRSCRRSQLTGRDDDDNVVVDDDAKSRNW